MEENDLEIKQSQKEMNALIRNFQDSIIFNDEAEPISDILSIIESPFIDRKDNDILSMIFHRFYSHTDIPITLPIFSFLSLISAYLVKNKTTCLIPGNGKKTELDTWVMCLAPSGSSKTMSMNKIMDLIPVPEIEGESLIEKNFTKPNGPAAFVQNLCALENGRGWWIQDEASQMFRAIEQEGSPMSECKEYLLEMKDHKSITRQNAQMKITSQAIVMTQLFINTIDSMAKHISDESFKDGLMRRYSMVVAQDDDRDFTDYALYDLNKLTDDVVKDELLSIMSQSLYEENYSFNAGCLNLYNKMFKIFWNKQFGKWMSDQKNIYRTYMMESWKYAVFHHIIFKKEGLRIDEKSMEWALKVVMFQLNSFQTFVRYRATNGKGAGKSIVVEQGRLDRFINYIKENENKTGFGIRAFCRKFNVKKEEAFRMLKSIKEHDKKFKTKLFDLIQITN